MMINHVPNFHGLKTAAIDGHHFSSLNQGLEILAQAEEQARAQGFQTLVGPMKNGTWGAYRLVLYSDGSPHFIGEPQSGPYDLEAYLKSGFSIAEMHSSTKLSLAPITPPTRDIAGISLRPYDGQDAISVLKNVHRITMQSFAKAPFFAPLDQDMFVQSYLPVFARADPRFLWMAYQDDGEMVGFLLSYPDPDWPETLIVKTYAALIAGVGRNLFDLVHYKAKEAGFCYAVHGLMREGNHSNAASRRLGGAVFRRYALMEKPL